MRKSMPLIIEELLFLTAMLLLWRTYFRVHISTAEVALSTFAISLGIFCARQICRIRFGKKRRTLFFWLTDGFTILALALVFCIAFSCLAILTDHSLDWQLIFSLAILYADGFIVIDRTISSMVNRATSPPLEQDDKRGDHSSDRF